MEDRDIRDEITATQVHNKSWGTSRHVVSGFVRLYGEDGVELSRRRFSNRYNRAIIIGHWMSMFGKTLNGKYYTIEPDYEEF